MLSKQKNTARLFSISLILGLLLITFLWLNLIEVAHAGNPERPESQRTDKASPLLKDNRHTPDEIVTVIVTLCGQRSGTAHWKWLNGDLALREWYQAVGRRLAFDVLHLVE